MQIDVKDRMDHRSNSKHTHTKRKREKMPIDYFATNQWASEHLENNAVIMDNVVVLISFESILIWRRAVNYFSNHLHCREFHLLFIHQNSARRSNIVASVFNCYHPILILFPVDRCRPKSRELTHFRNAYSNKLRRWWENLSDLVTRMQ